MLRATTAAALIFVALAGTARAGDPEVAPPTATATAAPAEFLDLAPLFVQLGWVKWGDRVTRVEGIEPTTRNARAILRAMATEERVSLVLVRPGVGELRVVVALPAPERAATPAGTPAEWGPAEDSELDEMSSAIGLTLEQRRAVQKIIMKGQQEFEKRLIAATQSGSHDVLAIERIGEEVSNLTRKEIETILHDDQKAKFDELMRKKLGAEEPGPATAPKK